MTNQELLIKLAHTKMPFGKYEGYHLIDLPEYYVVWYANKGFPKGQLGEQLKLVHELKLNGLEELVRNIRRNFPKQKFAEISIVRVLCALFNQHSPLHYGNIRYQQKI